VEMNHAINGGTKLEGKHELWSRKNHEVCLY
jgi:hypothetical protein